MTFAVYVKLKLSIDERIPDFLLLLEKKNIQLRPAYNVVLYSVFGNENISLQQKKSLPQEQQGEERSTRFTII